MIGFIIASIVTAGIIKGTMDITKQLQQTIRRHDEARRVIEYVRLHNISIREAHESCIMIKHHPFRTVLSFYLTFPPAKSAKTYESCCKPLSDGSSSTNTKYAHGPRRSRRRRCPE